MKLKKISLDELSVKFFLLISSIGSKHLKVSGVKGNHKRAVFIYATLKKNEEFMETLLYVLHVKEDEGPSKFFKYKL